MNGRSGKKKREKQTVGGRRLAVAAGAPPKLASTLETHLQFVHLAGCIDIKAADDAPKVVARPEENERTGSPTTCDFPGWNGRSAFFHFFWQLFLLRSDRLTRWTRGQARSRRTLAPAPPDSHAAIAPRARPVERLTVCRRDGVEAREAPSRTSANRACARMPVSSREMLFRDLHVAGGNFSLRNLVSGFLCFYPSVRSGVCWV